ncbi:hypothetical protein RND71_036394 [Anisodus tanguticus]|uniref:Uncharacterized protein n=1 Tax=Anisodus tanguticus TaxID=243964 RepID=A0AAE1V074_9SOLA|nr:hypothetical protein RND71_036394 [Anisodus tanguticus]
MRKVFSHRASFFCQAWKGSIWVINTFLKGVLPKIHPSNTLLELDISYTCISGELPDSVGTLSSLNRLGLRGCDFSGLIPHSNLGNNAINDTFPAWLGDLPELQPLELDEEDDSYFASGFTWESAVIGYSCGLVVGTVMWSLMFKAP